jgi:protein-tyrosine-phosphatase
LVNHILFICTGNTCRSPLAEGMLRKMATEAGLQIEVASAGVFAAEGAAISPFSTTVLKQKGIDEALASNALTDRWVDWADLILTMTMGHKKVVVERFPAAIEKVYTLKEYVQKHSGEAERIKEREQLYSEIQLKEALSQPVSQEERMRMAELELNAPGYDIADPYGGVLEDYQACAEEIEVYLQKLVAKLRDN